MPQIKTQSYGQESLSFRGSLHWNTFDDFVKNEPTLSAFKKRIKDWAGDKCTCKYAANFLYNVYFLVLVPPFFCLPCSFGTSSLDSSKRKFTLLTQIELVFNMLLQLDVFGCKCSFSFNCAHFHKCAFVVFTK